MQALILRVFYGKVNNKPTKTPPFTNASHYDPDILRAASIESIINLSATLQVKKIQLKMSVIISLNCTLLFVALYVYIENFIFIFINSYLFISHKKKPTR